MTSCLFHPNPSAHVVDPSINSVNLSLKVTEMQKISLENRSLKALLLALLPVLAQQVQPAMAL
tara:strand:+ start:80 stop:268 length:189 start_codon:yes stop_codon:yes gene_type:complete